jgi:hypothetical protein
MPDYMGNMTEAELDRAFAYLQKAWPNWRCPVDGRHRQYNLEPTLGQVSHYEGGRDIPAPGSYAPLVYPMLIVVCAVCGYTSLVSATRAGVIDG